MSDKLTDDEFKTTVISCPLNAYDCRDIQICEGSLQQHFQSEQHQRSLAEHAKYIDNTADADTTDTNSNMEDEHQSSLGLYEKLSSLAQYIDQTRNTLTNINENLVRHLISSFPQHINATQEMLSIEASSIDAVHLNETVLQQQIFSLKEQVNNGYGILPQERGDIIAWKITNVHEKMYDAMSERQTSIYSPPFYTSPTGYKLCIRLYLNGDGTSRGSHASIFLVVLRGEFDGILKWPFQFSVAFCLCDQRTILESNGTREPKHIIGCFKPDTKSISFQKPTLSVSIASGIPKFCPLDELNRSANENLYIYQDTMIIKTFINFNGIDRKMLDFIFNLNLALPVHIRQKLIEDEVARHQH
ncbi:unnamed protein product [Adineta ricciae]|uniref:MATH domain-containing protein n=1 Tax=Adineta ricciae TaxID=249248 RepID=A0A814RHJ2_ADIRI|nr:unnamed protein product [Adineta ricciae]